MEISVPGKLADSTRRLLRLGIVGFLVACAGFFVVRTIDWPLVNDPAQIHYMCFLMDHGRAPYKDIMEMNMPGIYVVNWTVMHGLGGGALPWRFFDLALMAIISIAMVAIAWPTDWLAGFSAASLLILFHGRDGPGQQGQRDLIIAVLLVAGCAFLFHALRKGRTWPWFFFGLCAMSAMTIKPTPLPFVLFLLLVSLLRRQRSGGQLMLPLAASLAGMVIPLTIVLGFLMHHHAVDAFLHFVRVVLPFYTRLGREGFPFLIRHSLTPSLWALFLLALSVALVVPQWQNWESNVLLVGIAFGLFSYFVQARGFPYHRYPLLAFLFLWAGLQFTSALRTQGLGRILGLGGIVFAIAVAPLYAVRASHRQWQDDFIKSLSSDLYALGGSQLSGHVQCLAMPADCDTVLYRMKLVQASGLAYDFFVFGAPNQPVVREFRAKFWQEIQHNPPTVVIVGEGSYPDNKDQYRKLERWPQLRDYLGDYERYDQREFPSAEYGPSGFRVYVRKND